MEITDFVSIPAYLGTVCSKHVPRPLRRCLHCAMAGTIARDHISHTKTIARTRGELVTACVSPSRPAWSQRKTVYNIFCGGRHGSIGIEHSAPTMSRLSDRRKATVVTELLRGTHATEPEQARTASRAAQELHVLRDSAVIFVLFHANTRSVLVDDGERVCVKP